MLAVAIESIRSPQNPDLFIGDIVPGGRSFIPNLLELRNQESVSTSTRSLADSAGACRRCSASNSNRRSSKVISFGSKTLIPLKFRAPGF
jgi:hypothetical protein